MNTLAEGLQSVGLKSLSEIKKEKVAALQAVYQLSFAQKEILLFTLERTGNEIKDIDKTISEFEKVLSDKTLQNTQVSSTFLGIFRTYLGVDLDSSFVFIPEDIFTDNELGFFGFEFSGKVWHVLFGQVLGMVVIPAMPKVSLYLAVPENQPSKNWKLVVPVEDYYAEYIPMLIGKKGANVKHIVELLSDAMTGGESKVITQIEFTQCS